MSLERLPSADPNPQVHSMVLAYSWMQPTIFIRTVARASVLTKSDASNDLGDWRKRMESHGSPIFWGIVFRFFGVFFSS